MLCISHNQNTMEPNILICIIGLIFILVFKGLLKIAVKTVWLKQLYRAFLIKTSVTESAFSKVVKIKVFNIARNNLHQGFYTFLRGILILVFPLT